LKEGVKRIKINAFFECTSLESITIPSTVTEVEEYAFNCCSSLREIVLHSQEVHIDDKSFYNCTSLERFKFTSLWTRLDSIIQAGQRDIEVKLDNIPAVEWRGGELIIPTVSRERENTLGRTDTLVEIDVEKLSTVKGLISYHEMKEATTLFELALWKARIDQVDDTSPVNHSACRIEVPGPVKDAILQYLR